MDNLLLLSDSYKASHWNMYPPDTEVIYSYFESRNPPEHKLNKTIFFGLQYLLKKYLSGQVVTKEKIDEAEEIINEHLGAKIFNRAGWQYILNEYGGKLPVRIYAVPEGSVIPTGNVLMTIENTDTQCYWLTSFLETLLVQLWYPCSVASQSLYMKEIIQSFLNKTAEDLTIDFKLHDFGMRGVSSMESAAIGGAAHLSVFKGTDTVVALKFLRDYYNESMGGFSIPACQHDNIISWGRENEMEAYKNILDQYPSGMVAMVLDSYDLYNCCRNIIGNELKDQILARDGVLVCRPDSGNPPLVATKVIQILYDHFGGYTNSKGYKVLNSKVRVIYGDGIGRDSISRILETIAHFGFSTENITFGSGAVYYRNLTAINLALRLNAQLSVEVGYGIQYLKIQ